MVSRTNLPGAISRKVPGMRSAGSGGSYASPASVGFAIHHSPRIMISSPYWRIGRTLGGEEITCRLAASRRGDRPADLRGAGRAAAPRRRRPVGHFGTALLPAGVAGGLQVDEFAGEGAAGERPAPGGVVEGGESPWGEPDGDGGAVGVAPCGAGREAEGCPVSSN